MPAGLYDVMKKTMDFFHEPVLLKETLHYWVARPDGFYVDLTLGCGGHSWALLESYPEASMLCMDWDPESLKIAEDRLQKHAQRVTFVNRNFAEVNKVLEEFKAGKVDGFLFDLGPSTFQILHSKRGLTYQKEEPLDMRMSVPFLPYPASTLLAELGASELESIFCDYGEIPRGQARRLAKEILSIRKYSKLDTSQRLAKEILKISTHRRLLAQVFQSLRITVNSEIKNLETLLAEVWDYLSIGGRIVGISFHSLEDRRVKKSFQSQAGSGTYQLLTKKSIRPSTEEESINAKSRSAKLRAIERLA